MLRHLRISHGHSQAPKRRGSRWRVFHPQLSKRCPEFERVDDFHVVDHLGVRQEVAQSLGSGSSHQLVVGELKRANGQTWGTVHGGQNRSSMLIAVERMRGCQRHGRLSMPVFACKQLDHFLQMRRHQSCCSPLTSASPSPQKTSPRGRIHLKEGQATSLQQHGPEVTTPRNRTTREA